MRRTKELADFLAGFEDAAYQRGYNDAVRDAARALKQLRKEASSNQTKEQANGRVATTNYDHVMEGALAHRSRRMRENSDQMRVLKAIRATPGMRGVEIVRALEAGGHTVQERTVRTALSRL